MSVTTHGELTYVGTAAADRTGVVPSVVGSYFFALDTKALYAWDGSAWQAVGSGGLPTAVVTALNVTEVLTGGPTVYVPTASYLGGSTIVFRNGVQQEPLVDYTETGSLSTITLASPTVAGDLIVMSYEKTGSLLTRTVVQMISGALVVGTGGMRICNLNGVALNLIKVHIAVSVAPTGAPIIVDVHKDGYTIFTTQAYRPQILAGAYSGFSTLIDAALWADGSYLTVDIDQVGSGVAGSNLTVSVVCQ